ncbi:hypothetical protein GCM10009727_06790 [Actinomadura napierensis]|uniref:Uncharacterized protein n=1 Tax=Actinomadura napierensis TaxID=267854 RepID=A0ABN2Y4L3_9ACTN
MVVDEPGGRFAQRPLFGGQADVHQRSLRGAVRGATAAAGGRSDSVIIGGHLGGGAPGPRGCAARAAGADAEELFSAPDKSLY